MNASRSADISRLATTFRESFNVKHPDDLERVIPHLDGTIVERGDDDSDEAAIRNQGSSFVIVLPHCAAPQRPTLIAHALGHLFLHMGYLVSPERWNDAGDYYESVLSRYNYNNEEAEAEEFAAALLLPEDDFVRFVNRHTSDGRCELSGLAADLRIPAAQALRRGRSLGVFG